MTIEQFVVDTNKRFKEVIASDTSFYGVTGLDPGPSRKVYPIEITCVYPHTDNVLDCSASCRTELFNKITGYLEGKSSLLVWRIFPEITYYDKKTWENPKDEVGWMGYARLYAE